MSSGTSTNVPAPGSSGSSTTASGSGTASSGSCNTVVAARIESAAANNFTMPPGTSLEQLSSQNWSVWHKVITAILRMNEVDTILTDSTCPSSVDQDDWKSVQKRTQAYLSLYCAPDVYSIVASDTDFPSFKDKFNRLQDTYGGVGSTAVFNLWIKLTQV
jgi:hypothetical protein